jgi:hypothetical protein
LPKLPCDLDRNNLLVGPPGDFVAMAMQLLMMLAAEWDRKFVADLASERSRLGKFEVVRIARLAPADQARLRGDKPQMGLIPPSDGFSERPDQVAVGRAIQVPRALCACVWGSMGEARIVFLKLLARCSALRRRLSCDRFRSRRLVSQLEQLGVRCLDQPGIVGGEGVFGSQPPMRPKRQVVGCLKTGDLGDQLIAQRRRGLGESSAL